MAEPAVVTLLAAELNKVREEMTIYTPVYCNIVSMVE
jgi:hypothetical protein